MDGCQDLGTVGGGAGVTVGEVEDDYVDQSLLRGLHAPPAVFFLFVFVWAFALAVLGTKSRALHKLSL